MRPGHANHSVSLLRDFGDDFSLFLAAVMSKKTLWPAFSSSVAQDLMNGSRSEISFRKATERNSCSLTLFSVNTGNIL